MTFSYISDINECLNISCENGGTCKDSVDSYTCDCADGYTGIHCETGENDCLLLVV